MSRVAIAQIQPVFLKLEETLDRICEAAQEAAQKEARLIVFPESFISGYPVWIRYLRSGADSQELDELYHRLYRSSVADIVNTLKKVCQSASDNNIAMVIGLNEIAQEQGSGTLYNSVVYINEAGQIINTHRKMMPTNPERMIWGFGDASGLTANDSPIGKIGTLICFENYMPLARSALYSQGMQVLIAPTFAAGETWISTMKHVAFEGRCWVISCGNLFKGSHYEIPNGKITDIFPDKKAVVNPGGSVIVSPTGEVVVGPIDSVEEIVYGEIDLAEVATAKRMLDVVGHYSRPDIFSLEVDRGAQIPVKFKS